MGIVDIQNPGLTAAIDTPQGFAVTPGKDDIDRGSETPGTGAVLGAAFRQGHTVAAALSSESIPDYVEDGFHMWNAIKDTKYERHWRSFVHIRNTQAADAMKRQIDREEEDRRVLKAAPWYLSMPMELLAGGSDPLNWVPGGVFVRGVKGGISIARSARSVGTAAGASTGAQELTLHGLQPTRDLSESATNIGASVFLGSLIGAAGAKLLSHAEWKRSVTAIDRDVDGYPAVATGDALSAAAVQGHTPGAARDTAVTADAAAAGNATVREGAVGAPDDGVSSAHGGRTGEAEAARAEGPRQQTDTGPGADPAAGREAQAADRAAGRAEREAGRELGPEDVARRDDRAGAAGERHHAGEALVPDPATKMAGAAGALRDQEGGPVAGGPAGRPSLGRERGLDDRGSISDGSGNRGLRDELPGRGGRVGQENEGAHAGIDSPAPGAEKEITAAAGEEGPAASARPRRPDAAGDVRPSNGPPREPIPPDGTKSSRDYPEAAREAASSRQEPGDSASPGVAVAKRADIANERLADTTNQNAAGQPKLIDELPAAHPDPEHDVNSWWRIVTRAFGATLVPVLPERFLRDIHGNGAVEVLKRLTPGQVAAADEGLARGSVFREVYTSGKMSVVRTGKLFLWSFLSQKNSPYIQESMFIDAFKAIDAWIAKAAVGRFNEREFRKYRAWARSVAPSGSGRPGASAKKKLIEFGQHFLIRMSQQNAEGVTHLQRLHDLLSDPNMTGQQIRREFLTFGKGSGVGNKVISLTLLMAGHTDVMVLDRVQIRALFGSTVNVDDYARLLGGEHGLLIYEEIERALAKRLNEIYAAAGRPDGASIGRYHWETWQAHSGQEASHETLATLLPHGNGSAKDLAEVRVRQGEYSAYDYGATYGVDDAGVPYYTYPKLSGGVHVFSVPAFREFLTEIRKSSSRVAKPGFRITKDGDLNVPWIERQEQGVDRQRVDDIASQKADGGNVGGRVSEDLTRHQMAGGSFGGFSAGGGDRGAGSSGIASAPAGAEEVTRAGRPQRPAEPPDGAASISEPSKAADQAALAHPDQAGPSGDTPKPDSDGKVRSAAAAGLAASGLAAASVDRGGNADDNTTVPRTARASQNPLERLMQSTNAAARDVAARLSDDRRGLQKRFEDVGFDASAETLMKDWNGGLTRALKGTRDAFTEHWKAAGPLDQREFNEAVGRALRNDREADDPQVARAAKLWRAQVLRPITDAAVKAGLLPDDVDPATAGSYFSRTWSRSKLFAMEREFKETVAQYAAERMTREQSTGVRADVRTSAREIADDLFDMLTGRSEADPHHRLHIPDALAAPFLEDNIELIGRRFVRALGADLELAQKFGTPDMAGALENVRAGYEKLRAEATDDDERLVLTRAERRDIADLQTTRDLIRGRRIDGPIERNYAQIVRAAERLDAIRATGEVSLPSLPDAVRPAMVRGLSAYMQTVDRLAADLKAVQISPDEAALAGRVGQRVLAHRLSSLADIDDPYASRTPVDAFLHKMTDTGSSTNGVRIFADVQKSFAAVMVQDRILKAVRERADLDGIGEHIAAQIAGQFEKHGEEIEGIRVANTHAWDKDDATAAALRVFRAAVNKGMGGFIANDTPTGQAMLALKNFALASYQRLLLRGLDAKAERFMGGLIAMTAMGMFVAWTASPEVASDAERWIGEGFDRSGIMAVPLELSDAFEKATGFDPLGPVKRPQTGTRLLPFNAYPGIRQMLGYALHPHN